MKRSALLPAFTFVLVLSGCRKDPVAPDASAALPVLMQKEVPAEVPAGEPMTQEELDRRVIGLLEERNDFRWEWVDLRTLWSAVQYNDHSLAIGYKPSGYGDISNKMNEIDLTSP